MCIPPVRERARDQEGVEEDAGQEENVYVDTLLVTLDKCVYTRANKSCDEHTFLMRLFRRAHSPHKAGRTWGQLHAEPALASGEHPRFWEGLLNNL